MRRTKPFKKEYYNENCNLYIYGAGNYGEIAFKALESMGIRPVNFLDKNHAGTEFCGVSVISPSDVIVNEYSFFLVASLNYFSEIVDYLISQNVDINNIFDIEELIKICPSGELSEYALDEKNNIEKYIAVINSDELNKLVVGHVDVVLTEKCTLRCRDCANLMQYYCKPENISVTKEIIPPFDRFLDVIDKLLEMRLLGGEPFIVHDIDKIIEYYSKNEKIGRIAIYTNSTIIPAEKILSVLKNDKVVVHMSNYGTVSNKVKELVEIFTGRNIKFYVHDYQYWNDLGGLDFRGYTRQEMNRLYSSCMMAKCYTFYRGVLYLCPRAAHGERLQKYINSDSEIIRFTDMSTNIERREKLQHLLHYTVALTACNYCNGSNNRSCKIEAAIQMLKREKE